MAKNELNSKSIDLLGVLQIVVAVVTAIVTYLETHKEDGKEVTNG